MFNTVPKNCPMCTLHDYWSIDIPYCCKVTSWTKSMQSLNAPSIFICMHITVLSLVFTSLDLYDEPWKLGHYQHFSWLVVLRIDVDLAIFQQYLDLEAGDHQSLKIQVARPGIEPRSSCSASQELNHSATAAPSTNILSFTKPKYVCILYNFISLPNGSQNRRQLAITT